MSEQTRTNVPILDLNTVEEHLTEYPTVQVAVDDEPMLTTKSRKVLYLVAITLGILSRLVPSILSAFGIGVGPDVAAALDEASVYILTVVVGVAVSHVGSRGITR